MKVGAPPRARVLALSRRRRAGNYALLFAIALVVLLGFGALAIDTSYMVLAHAQTQDLADATSQAALIALRQTGDQGLAEAAANEVLGQNYIAGEVPSSVAVTFGTWDDTDAVPSFAEDGVNPNAVRTTLGRSDADAVPFLLARIWGRDTFNVSATATSATRSLQLIIVNDITGSWGERNFANSREAVLGALDMLAESASGQDEIGMTIFTNRYAWEYTPFTSISDPAEYASVRADWEVLNIASKGGRDTNHYDGRDCSLYSGTRQNDFTNPVGGCYPDMPREYRDEPGTDHSTGILLAKEMFEDSPTGANYRAMIVLTDGRPNGLGSTSGQQRAAAGYTETRWNEYVGPVPRTVSQIRTASINACDDLWDDLRVNTWVVSLIQHDSMMPAMVQGDGYYVLTSDSGELADILAQIVSEMPLAIVE